jgi:hypothetical protein
MNQQSANARNLPPCIRCNTPMQPLMQMPVRTGGPDSGFVFFRNLQEMEERLLILDTYRCPRCRRLEFFDLDMSLPNR